MECKPLDHKNLKACPSSTQSLSYKTDFSEVTQVHRTATVLPALYTSLHPSYEPQFSSYMLLTNIIPNTFNLEK